MTIKGLVNQPLFVCRTIVSFPTINGESVCIGGFDFRNDIYLSISAHV